MTIALALLFVLPGVALGPVLVPGSQLPRVAVRELELQLEAVLQLELIGHDFFVFQNAETNEVNVVYRRRDGRYGLIEPQL